MLHRDFASRVSVIVKQGASNPRAAASELLLLGGRLRRDAKNAISNWHAQQCLGLAANLLARIEGMEAVKLHRRLAREHRHEAIYHLRALASQLEFAADSLRHAAAEASATRLDKDRAVIEDAIHAVVRPRTHR